MLLTLSSLCFAQNTIILNSVSKIDSLSLVNTIKAFIKAVEKQDNNTIKALCLKNVDCEMCIKNEGFDHPIEDAFVNIDTFINYLFDSLRISNICKTVATEIPSITSTSFAPADGNHPKFIKLQKGVFFTEYELSYLISNSENSYYFTFIKTERKFKLWKVSIAP